MIAMAKEIKNEGNARFGRGEWLKANESYASAIRFLKSEGEGERINDGREREQESIDVVDDVDNEKNENEGDKTDEKEEKKEETKKKKKTLSEREILLATLYANKAACHLKLCEYEACVSECANAIVLNEFYAKAYLRRAAAYEKLDDIEQALENYEKVVEIEEEENVNSKNKFNKSAYREKVEQLKPKVEQKREEAKKEMFKQLRSLGDMVLGNFGLSCDNFKAEKDENTGGFSLKFVQGGEKGVENTKSSSTRAAI